MAEVPEDYFKRGKGVRRGELEEELKFRRGILAWTWFKIKEKVYWILPYFWILVALAAIAGIIYGVYVFWGPVTTRTEVGLEKAGVPERISIAFRESTSWIKNKLLGIEEWKDPSAREERIKRGIEIVSFGPRDDFPTNVGEEVETIADVKVFALDEEDSGTSKISFGCKYEDGESGRIVIEGVEKNEDYARKDREESFDVRCVLPAVDDIEEEIEIKEVNFYASYEDFETVSTLHVGVLNKEEYEGLEREGTLLDFLKANMVYPNLIKGDRRAVSTYTNGPVKLALATNKLPLTEDREYSFIISFTPEITEWAGDIKVKQIELDILPEIFSITDCNFDTGGIWGEEFLENCEKGCVRSCDYTVASVEGFEKRTITATTIYDYTIKDVSTVTIRKVS